MKSDRIYTAACAAQVGDVATEAPIFAECIRRIGGVRSRGAITVCEGARAHVLFS